MWKNMIAIASIIFASGYFIQSLPKAHARLGPSTSFGSNPVFSTAGYANGSSPITINGQTGQDIILTDIFLSAQYSDSLELVLALSSNGQEVGRYKAWNYNNYSGSSIVDSHLISGLRVPAGDSLTVTLNGRGSYTLSGYYAQP